MARFKAFIRLFSVRQRYCFLQTISSILWINAMSVEKITASMKSPQIFFCNFAPK